MLARTIVAAALGIAVVLTGCGSPEGTGDSPVSGEVPDCPSDALEKATGPVNVTFWYNETAAAEQTLLGLVREYNQSQSKVQVVAQNQTTQTPGRGGILQKYQGAISSDQLPDLVEFADQEMVPAIDTGTLLPAQACLGEAGLQDIQAAVRNRYTVHDVYWPGHVGISGPVMYFNAAALEAAKLDPAKPPQTLDQLYATAKKLKAAGVKSPIAFSAVSDHVLAMLAGAGEAVVNENDGRCRRPDSRVLLLR
jgi:sn-glycerol 3-phosphate transport system substrate-binding protein